MNNRRIITMLRVLSVGLGLGLMTAAPQPAAGFCGFYVAGADASLYNDATMVVMMREGKRTVLAMQNDYQGPPEDFALVIPVPVVLQEGDVVTLPKALFDRVDRLAAPRLVEYWEQDPCSPPVEYKLRRTDGKGGGGSVPRPAPATATGVTVEVQFEVDEYQIVILSAKDSTGLDTWLRQENYNIPEGAEPMLRPYVEGGMKFFVAKVDAQKVKFERKPDGSERVQLSPLRFHYDSEEFALPVRLGLINASGPQDLLVHILAPKRRYEVANYPNVAIPTNLVVNDPTREHFGEFYVSLFDHTLAQNPKAVVTEYAWAAATCDPCPDKPLSFEELVLLGAKVLPSYAQSFDANGALLPGAQNVRWQLESDFVLTRLHARYDKASLGEDLVFAAAPGLHGGTGVPHDRGKLDPTIDDKTQNNMFQARYAILHPWAGAVECNSPYWDNWGGPPSGGGASKPAVARELAFVSRDAELLSYVSVAAQQTLKLSGAAPGAAQPDSPAVAGNEAPAERSEPAPPDEREPAAGSESKGCKCSSAAPTPGGPLAAVLGLGLLGLVRRKTQS